MFHRARYEFWIADFHPFPDHSFSDHLIYISLVSSAFVLPYLGTYAVSKRQSWALFVVSI